MGGVVTEPAILQETGALVFWDTPGPTTVQRAEAFEAVQERRVVWFGCTRDGVAVIATGPVFRQAPPVTVMVTGTAFAVPPSPLHARP